MTGSGGSGRIERKGLTDPDLRVAFSNGTGVMVRVAGLAVGRATLQPGWRWSRDNRPEVGTEQCEQHHFHVLLSGRLAFQMTGEEPVEFGPDDVFDVPPGHDAWVVGDEPAVVLDMSGSVDRFGTRVSHAGVVTTIVMTDIVDSTGTAGRLGEAAWRQVIARHDRVVRAQLDRFQGHEVVTTGDGFLATFDSAAAAVGCAAAIRDAVAQLGIACRVGVTTGEVEPVGDDIRGLAVHLAARVMAAAAPSEVLVTSVTRALVDGRGFRFVDRGPHQLKGFPEPVELSLLA